MSLFWLKRQSLSVKVKFDNRNRVHGVLRKCRVNLQLNGGLKVDFHLIIDMRALNRSHFPHCIDIDDKDSIRFLLVRHHYNSEII